LLASNSVTLIKTNSCCFFQSVQLRLKLFSLKRLYTLLRHLYQ
jgi:hypothetical protein